MKMTPGHYYLWKRGHLRFRFVHRRHPPLGHDQRAALGNLSPPDRAGGGGPEDLHPNGCTYCHTQFIRNIDWDLGAERVAHSGDYVTDQPHLLGTERTGPDLSQEGGEHPDDWHLAHFTNPRYVRPESIMPAWEFLGKEKIRALIAYKQSLGFKDADLRVAAPERLEEEGHRGL